MFYKTGILSTLAAFAAIAVAAQPFEPKGSTEGWNIFFNEKTKGCFAEHQTPEGAVLQMGTQANMIGVEGTNFGFLAIYVPAALDVAPGEARPVTFEFGDGLFGGTAIGVARDGYSGGYAVADSEGFFEEIAAQQTMTVNPGTERAFEVDLTGTRSAIEAVRACQAEMGG